MTQAAGAGDQALLVGDDLLRGDETAPADLDRSELAGRDQPADGLLRDPQARYDLPDLQQVEGFRADIDHQ